MTQPSVATESKQQIPFVDLKAQYATIKEEIRLAIDSVLESAHFVGGEWVDRFEEEFARFVGAKYAIGVGSGTAALELALRVAGIAPGDEVIVPANTFFATAEAVSNVGAVPVFADVDARTCHLDPFSAERALSPRTRAIIPVHLYGRAMDLRPIERLTETHGLHIIEDAAQAHGAARKGVRVGSGPWLTAFSFYPGKNLGAYGDAGAVTTNDSEQARKVRMLRDHGSPRKYQHAMVGTNSRLASIQAAVLSVKLPHLAEWNNLRQRHAADYAKALSGTAIQPPEVPPGEEHVFHLFVVRTRQRSGLQDFLARKGIATGIHYPMPLHLTEAYQSLGYPGRGSFPVSEQLVNEILSLPMFPELSDSQKSYTLEALLDFARRGARALP